MEIRKEQALFVGTLVILGLLYMSGSSKNTKTRPKLGATLELPAIPHTAEVLLDGGERKIKDAKRDLFVEPSDISVLPPLEAPALLMPQLPEFPIVLPLLRLGVDTAHWYRQRLSRSEIFALAKGTTASSGGDTPPANGADTGDEKPSETPDDQGDKPTEELANVDPQAEKEKAWAQQWDLMIYNGSKFWGKLLNKDPFLLGRPHPDAGQHLLELQAPFGQNRVIHFMKVNPGKGSVIIDDYKIEGEDLQKISFIRFANTISNQIAMKRVRIPQGELGLPEREAFILELLTKYRDYPEAFRAAEEQALLYIENNKASPRGHELLCLVYSVSGQLEKQLGKYEELMQSDFRNQSFIYRGLGTLEARLGMDEAAEEHLRQAIRLQESDAKARFALARFYREQSRGREALAEAERAVKNISPKLRKEEAFAIVSLQVACLLSQGMIEEAKTALLQAGNYLDGKPEDSPAWRLLSGAVAYQDGRFEEAAEAFAVAAEGMSDPVLPATGQALAQFRLGHWPDAMSAAEGGLNRDPLERYRVLTIKGFLQGSAAQGQADKLDEAVETFRLAQGMAPHAPYSLYILGHWLSQVDRFEEAEDALEDVLSRHAEIVEVMAEYALMLVRKAKAAGFSAEAHGLLTRAERYAKKVCEIEEGRAKLWIYQDLLGVIRYFLRNNDGARTAFRKAIAWAPADQQAHPRIFLALLNYRDGRTDDTLAELNNLRQTLKPGSPLHSYVGQVRAMIQHHANLRVFRTPFDLPGKVEKDFNESRGLPRWDKTKGDVRVDGKSEGQPVWLRKTVPGGAGKLEDVSVKVKVGADFSGRRVVLRITDQPIKPGAKASRSSYEYLIGYEQGLRISLREGGKQKKPLVDQWEARGDFAGAGLSFKRGETHTLGFKVLRDEAAGKQATLIVLMDGEEVARAKVAVFAYGKTRNLHLDLLVEGDKRSTLQASFDDFEMVRLD